MWMYRNRRLTKEDLVDKIGFLYCVFLPNGKRYIGQTKRKDWWLYWGGGTILSRYYKKYGKEGVKRVALMIYDDLDEMDNEEINLIDVTNAQESKQYYNIAKGGRDKIDIPEETRKRQGMTVSGSNHYNSFLTDEKVEMVLRVSIGPDAKRGYKARMAELLDVGHTVILGILSRKSWKNIEMPTEPMRLQEMADRLGKELVIPEMRHPIFRVHEKVAELILRVSLNSDNKRGYQERITEFLNVTPPTISAIITRKTFKKIPMPTKPLSLNEFYSLAGECRMNSTQAPLARGTAP